MERVYSFFEQVAHGLWLDPDAVRARYDVDEISKRQRPMTNALIIGWNNIAPNSDAAVVEFDFRAIGNAKRKLLRRVDGYVSKYRGGFSSRKALSLKRLADYALAYDIVARECGGELVAWRYLPSPLPR